MRDSFSADLPMLYEQLLNLAEKEEQALTGDNLEELEACMCRKEEIVTKLSPFNLFCQILIRRHDNAHVDLNSDFTTHGIELALLKDPEQFRLGR